MTRNDRFRNLGELVTFGAPLAVAPTRNRRWLWLSAGVIGLALALGGSKVSGAAPPNLPVVIQRLPALAHGTVAERPLSAAPAAVSMRDVADAQARAGFAPVVISGDPSITISSVTYDTPAVFSDGKRLGTPAIKIDYIVAGKAIQVITNAPQAGNSFQSAVKPSSVVVQRVETIGGSQYLVIRTANLSSILLVGWRTADGRTVYINATSSGGIDDATLAVLLQHAG